MCTVSGPRWHCCPRSCLFTGAQFICIHGIHAAHAQSARCHYTECCEQCVYKDESTLCEATLTSEGFAAKPRLAASVQCFFAYVSACAV